MSSLVTNSNLSAFLATTGTEAKPTGPGYVTLTAANWYIPIPLSQEGLLQSIHIQTDGTVAASAISLEGCNFAKEAPGSVTDYDETSGGIWVPVNNAAFGILSSVGTGWTVTVLSAAKTAGAGSAIWSLINPNWKRLRVKVVCTTPGTLRTMAHGKH